MVRRRPTTIIYASLDQPNDKLVALLFAAEALRRDGASGLSCWRPISATCVRTPPFMQAKRSAKGHRPAASSGCFDRVITVDAHLHRTAGLATCFPASRPTICRPCRPSPTLCARPGIDPDRRVGPDAESRPWVTDSPTCSASLRGCAKRPAWAIARSKSALDDRLIAGRPALLVDDIVSSGGTMMACAKALHRRRRHVGRCDRHSRAVSRELARMFASRHPLDPLHPQRAAFHQHHAR